MNKEHVEYITAVVGRLSLLTGKPANVVYTKLHEANLIDNYLVDCYDVLHTFSLDYVANDIVDILQQKGIQL